MSRPASSPRNHASTIFARGEFEHAGLIEIELFAGRRNAEQRAAVRAGDAPQHAHHVALGDDFLDDVVAVGNRTAQIFAVVRKVLARGIVGEVLQATASALVIGAEELRPDRRQRLRFGGGLVAKHHLFVALGFRGLRQSGVRQLRGECKTGAGGLDQEFAAGQHRHRVSSVRLVMLGALGRAQARRPMILAWYAAQLAKAGKDTAGPMHAVLPQRPRLILWCGRISPS